MIGSTSPGQRVIRAIRQRGNGTELGWPQDNAPESTPVSLLRVTVVAGPRRSLLPTSCQKALYVFPEA
jgi:hypothetical protein